MTYIYWKKFANIFVPDAKLPSPMTTLKHKKIN